MNPIKPEKEKKPAISEEEILEILTKSVPKEEEKKFAPGEGFDWYPEMEEETLLQGWIDGKTISYEEDEPKRKEKEQKENT